ncbi:MAG: hypothetical protein AAFV71_28505 [Cyanobacteria bacterium J06633_8]
MQTINFHIYLPLDPSFDDYPRRMYEVMEVLEKAENRFQLDILSELITIVHNVTVRRCCNAN